MQETGGSPRPSCPAVRDADVEDGPRPWRRCRPKHRAPGNRRWLVLAIAVVRPSNAGSPMVLSGRRVDQGRYGAPISPAASARQAAVEGRRPRPRGRGASFVGGWAHMWKNGRLATARPSARYLSRPQGHAKVPKNHELFALAWGLRVQCTAGRVSRQGRCNENGPWRSSRPSSSSTESARTR